MAKLRLYFSGKFAREGKSLEQTLRLLWELEPTGVGCELVDTDRWTEEQLRDLYDQAVGSAVRNGYGIRMAFGSRGDGRLGFGKYVPALLVYDDADHCIAVYPHLEGERRVDIPEYLVGLLRGREGPLSP